MHKEVPAQGRTTVVYIEGDRTNASLMQFLLGSRTNYALHHANDGLSGLELCRRVKPDMVITEMHLPDVTAYKVLQGLRGDSSTQGLPCIVLSGDAMPAHIEQALTAGFDAYWTKPIDVWQLMQNIDDVACNATLQSRRRRSASTIKAACRQGSVAFAQVQHWRSHDSSIANVPTCSRWCSFLDLDRVDAMIREATHQQPAHHVTLSRAGSTFQRQDAAPQACPLRRP